jgi:alpha-1,2-mannosyltransferase
MASAISQLFTELRSGAWLDRRRLLAFSGIVLALELIGGAFLVAGTHGLIVPLDKPATTDFVSFYAAGRLADAGAPALAYDESAHYAAEQKAAEPGIDYVHFFYPPVFLMLCAAVARLPYLAAFGVFVAVTMAAFLFAMRRILDEAGWAALLPVLAFPSVLWTAGFGQNSFLTAALFGVGTLQVDRRPIVAGLVFGALAYKPHFGLLVAVALAAGGHWRAFTAAAISAAALALLSTVLFGWDSWHAFIAAAAGSHTAYETGTVDHAAFVNPYGAVLVLGGGLKPAYAAQGLAIGIAAAFVGWVWRRGLSLPVRGAALAAATLVAMPVVLFYDLVLATIAAAWLVRAAQQRGWLPWEKTALALLFVVPAMARGTASQWHLPLGPLAVLGLLALVAAAARRELSEPALLRPEAAAS